MVSGEKNPHQTPIKCLLRIRIFFHMVSDIDLFFCRVTFGCPESAQNSKNLSRIRTEPSSASLARSIHAMVIDGHDVSLIILHLNPVEVRGHSISSHIKSDISFWRGREPRARAKRSKKYFFIQIYN